MARLYKVSQFPALQVIQFDARVAVHVAAHHRLARRGVGVEVDVALAPAEVVLDAYGIVGDERLWEGLIGEHEGICQPAHCGLRLMQSRKSINL